MDDLFKANGKCVKLLERALSVIVCFLRKIGWFSMKDIRQENIKIYHKPVNFVFELCERRKSLPFNKSRFRLNFPVNNNPEMFHYNILCHFLHYETLYLFILPLSLETRKGSESATEEHRSSGPDDVFIHF